MTKDFYISLIYKELDSNLSDEERKELELWCNEDANAKIKAEIVGVWNLVDTIDDRVEIDLDEDYAALQSKMNASPALEKKANPRLWMSIAAGFAILVAALWGSQMFSSVQGELVSHAASTSDLYFMLEDGSEVYLQKGSSISYLQPMNPNRRVINLGGEAVFHVAHDKNWPLDVVTYNETITVLGTKFHVLEQSESTSIQLIEGKIAVTDNAGNSIAQLTEGQALNRSYASGTNTVTDHIDHNRFVWQSDELKFTDTRLVNVVDQLEAYYNISIDTKDAMIEQCKLSGTFRNKTLDQIMTVISDIHNIDISKTGDTVFWKGGQCE